MNVMADPRRAAHDAAKARAARLGGNEVTLSELRVLRDQMHRQEIEIAGLTRALQHQTARVDRLAAAWPPAEDDNDAARVRFVSVDKVAAIVAEDYGITVEDLRSKRGRLTMSDARAAFVILALRYTDQNRADLARFLADRDHSTIRDMAERAARRADANATIAARQRRLDAKVRRVIGGAV